MVLYRRNKLAGGTYFFTANLKNRKNNFLIKYYPLLQKALLKTKYEHPFLMKAFVVLPDHLHTIWELPKNDCDYSLRWRKLKRYFTLALKEQGLQLIKNKHNEYGIWQRRYWEHTIRNDIDYVNHINYIHYNPIKHGYVSHLKDWPYSSFMEYVSRGYYPEDWSSGSGLLLDEYGE